MLDQIIPPYEGSQPFLYACYCAEDEALAFPILARMYNEGFRLFSALGCRSDRTSVRGDSDFRSVQRINSSSSVILFMSHNMLERIRQSDPEVITAVKSPCLRTVINLDDSEPSGDIYALSVPDKIEYSHGNDAHFWLYIYSSDYLEKCRGPWPDENHRLRLSDASYGDVSQEALDEEYIRIQNILAGKSGSRRAEEKSDFSNNDGYIMPTPDEFVYIPLTTTGDKRVDELISLLDEGTAQANDIINSQQQTVVEPEPEPEPEFESEPEMIPDTRSMTDISAVSEPYPEPNWDVVPEEAEDPERTKPTESLFGRFFINLGEALRQRKIAPSLARIEPDELTPVYLDEDDEPADIPDKADVVIDISELVAKRQVEDLDDNEQFESDPDLEYDEDDEEDEEDEEDETDDSVSKKHVSISHVRAVEPEPEQEAPAEEKVDKRIIASSATVPVMVRTSPRAPESKRIRASVTEVRKMKLSPAGLTQQHMTAAPDSAAIIDASIRDKAYLQNYARRLVMEAMAETVNSQPDPQLENARKHSRKPALQPEVPQQPAVPQYSGSASIYSPQYQALYQMGLEAQRQSYYPQAAAPMLPNRTQQYQPSYTVPQTTLPQYQGNASADEQYQVRKNKHPHNSRGLADLIASLRPPTSAPAAASSQQTQIQQEPTQAASFAPAVQSVPTQTPTAVQFTVQKPVSDEDAQSRKSSKHSKKKSSDKKKKKSASEEIKEPDPKESMLEIAVNKFMKKAAGKGGN